MDMIDSIECVSSSDGMEDDDAVSSNLPRLFLKTSVAAAATAAAVVVTSIGVVPSGGGASDDGITRPLISPAMSVHELLECPVCTNSMYPRSTRFWPGKIVPENILINYVGLQHVHDVTIEAILRHTFPQALSSVEDRALEDSVRILTKFEDMRNSFSLKHVFRYDVIVDVAPEVQWLSEDKYKNLKVVVEIDEIVDAEKTAEIELKRHHKALGLLRIVTDRGLQDEDAGWLCRKFM